jgi:hypothetical protein
VGTDPTPHVLPPEKNKVLELDTTCKRFCKYKAATFAACTVFGFEILICELTVMRMLAVD